MNVILDGQPLLGSRTGIGRYTYCLVEHLKRQQEIHNLSLLFNQLYRTARIYPVVKELDVSYRNTRYPYKVIRRLGKPRFLYQFPIDIRISKKEETVFHGTNFVTLPTWKAKQVITIHDLAFMLYPETTDEKIYRHHMKWVPYSAERADWIIADSEHTKRDIMRLLNVSAAKITVVPLAAEEKFRPCTPAEIQRVREKYRLPERYVLYVGTLEPRKNLPVLLEAFALAKRKERFREKLVIAGARGWKYHPIFESVRRWNLHDDVLFTDYVVDEDLPALYSGATLFAFPSLYEGFGLPLLEAMQCGTPVMASDSSSIPEVVGDAGILCSPLSVEEWVEQLSRILLDDDLRKTLTAKGLQRAGQFSWERTAKETKRVYEQALNTHAKFDKMIEVEQTGERASL